MTRLLALTLILSLVAALSACAPPFVEMSTDMGYSQSQLNDENSGDPYVRVYQALRETLRWYTYSQEGGGPSDYPAKVLETTWPERQNRRLVVQSRINADGLTRTMMRIEAYPVRDRYNEVFPEVRVYTMMDSKPDMAAHKPAGAPAMFGPADGNARWIPIARNERMEARLMNVCLQMLDGGNLFSGRFGMDSRPWVEWVPQREPVPDIFLPQPEEEDDDADAGEEGPKPPEGQESPADDQSTDAVPSSYRVDPGVGF